MKNVTFEIRRGETLGLVGESGSGKSTIGRLVMRLTDADASVVRIRRTGFLARPVGDRPARRPQARPNGVPGIPLPRSIRVAASGGSSPTGRSRTASPYRASLRAPPKNCWRWWVSTPGPRDAFRMNFQEDNANGSELRALTLALDPEVLVADEPVSALDVSVQAQVLALLETLKARLRLAVLFITHDLNVAAQVCDRIAVMRLGEIVEIRPTADLLERPEHPYTQAATVLPIPGQAHKAPQVTSQIAARTTAFTLIKGL